MHPEPRRDEDISGQSSMSVASLMNFCSDAARTAETDANIFIVHRGKPIVEGENHVRMSRRTNKPVRKYVRKVKPENVEVSQSVNWTTLNKLLLSWRMSGLWWEK
jgi:predicted peroxiredoxin